MEKSWVDKLTHDLQSSNLDDLIVNNIKSTIMQSATKNKILPSPFLNHQSMIEAIQELALDLIVENMNLKDLENIK